MVKVNLELDCRTRQRHFATTSENRRLNTSRFKQILHQLNLFFGSFGLGMRKIELTENLPNERQPEFELQINSNQASNRSLEFDCQFLREMINMSEKDYKLFERVLSVHLKGIPKLYTSNAIKFRMNDLFRLASNSRAIYLENPIDKIKFMLNKFVQKYHFIDKYFHIKFSGGIYYFI